MPSGSQPGKVNALEKLHREGTPPRPAVAMLGTVEYHPVKYIASITNENIHIKYMSGFNASFIYQSNEFSFIPSHGLVSRDVES